jgi:hypothetical protein
VISVHARHVTSAETGHATSGEATHMTPAEAADVTSAKAAHMASATTSMSTATAAATAGLCIRGKKAAGKHCACQNHYYSSSHDILLWDGRTCRNWALSDAGVSEEDKCRRRDGLKMRMLICRFH